MREQIRILEGVWGDDDNDEDSGRGQYRRHGGATDRPATAKTRSAKAAAAAAAAGGEGSNLPTANSPPGTSAPPPSLSAGGEKDAEDGRDRSAPAVDGDGAAATIEKGRREVDLAGAAAGTSEGHAGDGDSTPGAGGELLRVEGLEEAGVGEGRGDAAVDAWLISYNRRLKKELERLRARTRLAEDRFVSFLFGGGGGT